MKGADRPQLYGIIAYQLYGPLYVIYAAAKRLRALNTGRHALVAEVCARQDNIFTLWPVALSIQVSENTIEFIVRGIAAVFAPAAKGWMQVKDLMDSNIIKKTGTFYSMIAMTEEKTAACCEALGVSVEKEVLSKPIGSSARILAGSKRGIVGTKKRKKGDEAVSKRPRTGSKKESVAANKS